MVQCYLTGTKIQLDDAYVLDVTAARHALCDLRDRIRTIERLVDELGASDKVEVQDWKKGGAKIQRKDRRLICKSMALALSAACPEKEIFVPFNAWLSHRKSGGLLKGSGEVRAQETQESPVGAVAVPKESSGQRG